MLTQSTCVELGSFLITRGSESFGFNLLDDLVTGNASIITVLIGASSSDSSTVIFDSFLISSKDARKTS